VRGTLLGGLVVLFLLGTGFYRPALADTTLPEQCDPLSELPPPEQCLNHTSFLRQSAARLLSQGDIQSALIWLERAVMLAPDSPEILLEFGLAAAQLQDNQLASQVLAPLIQSSALSDSQRRIAAAALAQVQASTKVVLLQRRFSFQSELGYDSNFSNGLSATELTLTLPNGENIRAPLDFSEKPRAGLVAVGSGRADWFWGTNTALHSGLSLNLLAQRPLPKSGYESETLEIEWRAYSALIRQLPLGGTFGYPSRIALRGLTSRYANRPLLSGGGIGLAWPADFLARHVNCDTQLEFDLEARLYAQQSRYDSNQVRAALDLLCPYNAQSLAIRGWAVADLAKRDRPGGDTFRTGTRASLSATTGRWVWSVYGNLEWSRDSKGFSPLLASDAPRTTFSWSAGTSAKLSSDLTNLSYIARAETRSQSSNLALYELRSNVLLVGLEWQLD
jgi:hypothetical protein